MKLLKVFTTETENHIKLVGVVESSAGKIFELFFEYPAAFKTFINATADPFFPVLLIPAMQMGEDLVLQPGVSEKLISGATNIQDIFTNWYPGIFQKVSIHHHGVTERIKTSDAAGQFFSLGVDSFYTLLKNRRNNLTHLIYMQGLELPLSRYSHNQEQDVLQNMKNVCAHYEMELIHGRTNFRDYFDLDWPKYYHGAGLAATALSLAGGLGKIYIASSHSYGAHIPVGSSFMLDHYWSTEQQQIIHDGAEKGRGFKVADLVAGDDFAIKNLRVCTENDGGHYNCCRCRKCISTMASLEIIGKLSTCEAFPQKKVSGEFYKIQPYNLSSYALTKDLYNLAVKYKRYDLAKEIERELLIGHHDLYGRREVSVGILKYTGEFLKYLFLKFSRNFLTVLRKY